jgi:predicted phosphoribosyltransferase
MRVFADRIEAGIAVGHAIAARHPAPPLLVLGLPRGGVPLAREVARILGAPLDVLIVRKIGMPLHPELAIGAVASGGAIVREAHGRYDPFGREIDFEALATRELEEVRRREKLFRGGAEPLDVRGKTVVLVDDGLATGSTMTAAVRAVRSLGASRIIVAAPVASREAFARLARAADDCVILSTPPDLYAVSQAYEEFPQVDDAVVQAVLRDAAAEQARPRSSRPPESG